MTVHSYCLEVIQTEIMVSLKYVSSSISSDISHQNDINMSIAVCDSDTCYFTEVKNKNNIS